MRPVQRQKESRNGEQRAVSKINLLGEVNPKWPVISKSRYFMMYLRIPQVSEIISVEIWTSRSSICSTGEYVLGISSRKHSEWWKSEPQLRLPVRNTTRVFPIIIWISRNKRMPYGSFNWHYESSLALLDDMYIVLRARSFMPVTLIIDWPVSPEHIFTRFLPAIQNLKVSRSPRGRTTG